MTTQVIKTLLTTGKAASSVYQYDSAPLPHC